jgi:hypothetical protein
MSGNYKFYSVASDKLGNTELPPISFDAEASITVSIQDNILTNKEIKVWPNPTNGIINLDLIQFYGEDVTIELKTIVGQTVMKNQINSVAQEILEIDLREIPKDVYLLLVRTDKKEAIKKIVFY